MLATGSGSKITNTKNFEYFESSNPIVLRSILKHKIIKQCWHDGRDFYYIDTGYFGNRLWKKWHRIVKNDLQHNEIINRPADRWEKLKVKTKVRKYGRKILIAAPGEKPCIFYGINKEQWVQETVETIQKYTDRPIVIREKNMDRSDRVRNDPLYAALEKDVHALVTFNSNAGVESILNGVPAFVLAPTHAAKPVSGGSLENIDNPYFPSHDKLLAWCHHLAYGQFHVQEMADGTAYRILNEH